MKVFSIIRKINNRNYFLSDAGYVGGNKSRLAIKIIWVSDPEISKALFNHKERVQKTFNALLKDYGGDLLGKDISIKVIEVKKPKESIRGV